MPDIYSCEIIEKKVLTDAVFSITVSCDELAKQSTAGQFLHIKCGEARILRRPISICSIKGDGIRFVFEVKGEGTRWLSEQSVGEKLNILGPLGKGFDIPNGKIIVVGGGVGTPPMLLVAESVSKNNVTAILGFRSADRIILTEEFKEACDKVIITTDDGSMGIHGAVTKPLEELLKTDEYIAVMSCGQLLMQKAVADICTKHNVPCQVSLEERMGCGVGACLVCACATIFEDTQMSRVCIDGPVFSSSNIVW
jgi:dihydroorotate dehydrogenase electron transfer subunit